MISPLPDHGSVGTSAVWATKLDAILSPNAHMAFSEGPIKEMLFLCSSSGNLGFSDAWPQPAQTACQSQQFLTHLTNSSDPIHCLGQWFSTFTWSWHILQYSYVLFTKHKTTRRLYECRSHPSVCDLISKVTLPVKFVRNSVFKKFGIGILYRRIS